MTIPVPNVNGYYREANVSLGTFSGDGLTRISFAGIDFFNKMLISSVDIFVTTIDSDDTTITYLKDCNVGDNLKGK
jgi:hypothetical protein